MESSATQRSPNEFKPALALSPFSRLANTPDPVFQTLKKSYGGLTSVS